MKKFRVNAYLLKLHLFKRDFFKYLGNAFIGIEVQSDFYNAIDREYLIKKFIENKYPFNDNTPHFIRWNLECIKVAIEEDIYSIEYITPNIPEELHSRIIELAILNKYILNEKSTLFLKSSYSVAKSSITANIYSADYIDWNSMNNIQTEELKKHLINNGYILNENSCNELRACNDIIFNSIKKDVKLIEYANIESITNPEIINYLIANKCEFNESDLPLINLSDSNIMKHVLNKFRLNIYVNDCYDIPNKSEYIEKYAALCIDIINNKPSIKSINTVLDYYAELDWEDYKKENANLYSNIFSKICLLLKSNYNFEYAKDTMKTLLNEMELILNDKYEVLLHAMKEYHEIVNSKEPLNGIDYSRDKISELSALYISKSKENFKKKYLSLITAQLYEYFIPRKDNPIVYKKVFDNKYMNAFCWKYNHNNIDIINFIDNLIDKYSDIGKQTVQSMINNFLRNGQSKMDKFIKAPKGWNNHKKYLEACKLIKRLNLGFIKYTDQELNAYLNIIKYDSEQNIYYYDGPKFTKKDLSKYAIYRKKLDIFASIKQEIIFKAKTLQVYNSIEDDELIAIKDQIPFNDKFFEINYSKFNALHFVKCMIDDNTGDIGIIPNNILFDDEVYNTIKKYIISNSLIWLHMITGKFNVDMIDESVVFNTYQEEYSAAFDLKVINVFDDIIKFKENNETDYKAIEDTMELITTSSSIEINILGKNIIHKLYRDQNYIEENKPFIKYSAELICKMRERHKSTVPYISGESENYKYSLYDINDVTALTSGLDTDACFRVCGHDNDFLHYCLLDKNGFIIKITDKEGNFVGRASGFRNGNCVFINQLRTIYDVGGSGYYGEFSTEQREIINVFKAACNNIIEVSQNEPKDTKKIDYVFATQSYILTNEDYCVNSDVSRKIGSFPMDNHSSDWKKFIKTKNLSNKLANGIFDGFTTDYGNYQVLCVASSKKYPDINAIKPNNLHFGDVKAIYDRPRNKIIVTTNGTKDMLDEINRLYAISAYHENTDEFMYYKSLQGNLVVLGDNWFVIIEENGEMYTNYLKCDKIAKAEMLMAIGIIKEELEKGIVKPEECEEQINKHTKGLKFVRG